MPLAIVALVAALALAAGPALFPDFGGFDPSQFKFDGPVATARPIGWAFLIWIPIYVWLVAGAVYGLWQRANDEGWMAMRPSLILSCGIGAAWLPVAGEMPIVATLMIWAMLLTALAALFRSPTEDSLWASWPVGFYAGWLTAASCVSLGLCLVGYDVMKPDVAAMVVMALAICISAAVQLSLARAPTYGLSVMWAFIGIGAANMSTSPNVAGLAMGGAIGMAALTLLAMLKEQRFKREIAAA